MQGHPIKNTPLNLSDIKFMEEFINKNMLSSVPKHYIKEGSFNVNLLTGLVLGSLCELHGAFNLTNGVLRLLFGNADGEIDIQKSDEKDLMTFIGHASQLNNYYAYYLLNHSFKVELLENDKLVDYANIDSSTHYYAVWMPFYEVVKTSFKHAAKKIKLVDTVAKRRALQSFNLLEEYVTKSRYTFEEFEAFVHQFPKIVLDLYLFSRELAITFQLPKQEAASLKAATQPLKTSVKIGRNDPCPCGSDKKYKQCCINLSSTKH